MSELNGMIVKGWRVPYVLLLIPLLVCLSLLFFVDVFQYDTYNLNIRARSPVMATALKAREDKNGFLIHTEGCRIPYMDPFDEHIRKFIEKPKPIECNYNKPALFDSDLRSIYLVEDALSHYQIYYEEDFDRLNCCYNAFYRINPKKNDVDDRIKFDSECIPLNTTEVNMIADEFIKVTCKLKKRVIYIDMFAFVPVKPNITYTSQTSNLNVLVIGLDAVSRVNFHRQMPKTVKTLNELGAVDLLAYNKVGDNTFPNLMPVLTGYSEDELEKTCWKNGGYFDDCPYIWKNFKENGYVTAFGEDAAWMGIFNYERKGFLKQQTDYSYGYFNAVAEKQLGNAHQMNVFQCIGARETYKTLLDYVMRFNERMHLEHAPFFGFFWGASLSHDYLNKPNLGDKYYANFFRSLRDNGYLDNTAVIFMSDHGIRWGGIRQTYQGRMEERLPFVYFLLPDWFKMDHSQWYRNLLRNKRMLTSPYDLHETFRDLLELKSHPRNDSRIGRSLFSEINATRRCEDAGIVMHWCTCQTSIDVSLNDSKVVQGGNYAVYQINKKLEGFASCAKLTLAEILSAQLMSHSNEILAGEKTVRDYMLTIRTTPGDAIFEYTVRLRIWPDKWQKYELLGTISRLNLYGKQSSCITDFHLKLYCFCQGIF